MDFTHSLLITRSFSGAEHKNVNDGKRELRTRHASTDISLKSHFPNTHFDTVFLFSHNAEICWHISSCDFATMPLSHIDLKFNNFFFWSVTNRLSNQSQTSTLPKITISIHLADFKFWSNLMPCGFFHSSVLPCAPITINQWRILITRKESGKSFAV